MRMLFKIYITLLIVMVVCVSNVSAAGISDVTYFDPIKNNRSYQGVCSDGTYIYTTTDQDENFKINGYSGEVQWDNNNIISVYDMEGNFIREKKNVYDDLSPKGLFMSFGDCSVIDGAIFATVYDRVEPSDSRVLKINKDTSVVENVYDIGQELAEGVDKHNGDFWVVYHTKMEIRQYDADFNLKHTHQLSQPMKPYGGYQGLFWIDDDVYVNYHGANLLGEDYAPGVDRYHFNGQSFEFVEQIKPPTYGSGQGIEKVGDTYLWIDRPMNRVVVTKSLRTSAMKSIGQTLEIYTPTLLHGWGPFDTEYDRAPVAYKDSHGFVHLEGMMKGGDLQQTAFILPKGLRPAKSKNFAVVSNDAFGRVGIIGNQSTSGEIRAGEVLVMVGSTEWVSLDGISFLAEDTEN